MFLIGKRRKSVSPPIFLLQLPPSNLLSLNSKLSTQSYSPHRMQAPCNCFFKGNIRVSFTVASVLTVDVAGANDILRLAVDLFARERVDDCSMGRGIESEKQVIIAHIDLIEHTCTQH